MDAKIITRLLHARAEEFCRRYLPNGRKEGHEWLVGDATGSAGRSLGVQLDGDRKGLWNDRASDEGGTLLDLLKIQRGDFPKAADEARRFLGLPGFRPHVNGNGHCTFDPLKKPWRRTPDSPPVLPTAAWPYHASDGSIVAYACRFQFPDGKKDVLPLRHLNGEWRWKGWTGDERRPIYNLHLLKQRPDAPVLIVEGEKKADAGRRLFPDLVTIAWQGGCKAVQKVDWSPITGRKTPVVLWPDADAPGQNAMLYLKARFPESRLVTLPKGLPDGWDIADDPPENVSLRGILDGALHPPSSDPGEPDPFRLLGFDENNYYYAPASSGIVTSLEAPQHGEMQLQRLAPDDYWQQNYPGRNKTDYTAAAKDLIARQHRIGFFNPEIIRGLGCWMDAGRVIYHAGDRLLIDGVETSLARYKGEFLYPRRRSSPIINPNDFLSVHEVRPFLDLCGALRWRIPENFWMLAGWIVAAIVGGVLDWRPHIWLHGLAGCGKSTAMNEVIAPVILNAIRPKSNSTEAGIRSLLELDALSVLFDELEPRDDRAIQRHSAIIELVRQSSSETGGSIFKGTATGHVKEYRIRSCFCFASIAPGVREAADESRITRLELAKGNESTLIELKELIRQTVLEPAYCRRLFSRAIAMARHIQTATRTLQRAIARQAGDARTGQQYGALAGGFWSLISDHPPTVQQAEEWAARHSWEDVKVGGQDREDPERCLEAILQSRVLFELDGYRETLSIGELLAKWFEIPPSHKHHRPIAATLARYGVHPINQQFDIADRHNELAKLLKETPYKVGWRDHLMRLEGAIRAAYTPSGGKTLRCVRIPRNSVEGLGGSGDDEPTPDTQQELPAYE